LTNLQKNVTVCSAVHDETSSSSSKALPFFLSEWLSAVIEIQGNSLGLGREDEEDKKKTSHPFLNNWRTHSAHSLTHSLTRLTHSFIHY
jgi:hypothetical protein